jgi:hypothetical protein
MYLACPVKPGHIAGNDPQSPGFTAKATSNPVIFRGSRPTIVIKSKNNPG